MYYRNVQEVIDFLKRKHEKYTEIVERFPRLKTDEVIKGRMEEILVILEEISK